MKRDSASDNVYLITLKTRYLLDNRYYYTYVLDFYLDIKVDAEREKKDIISCIQQEVEYNTQLIAASALSRGYLNYTLQNYLQNEREYKLREG